MNDNTAPLDIQQVWSTALAEIRDQVSSHNYKSWFAPLKLVELTDEDALIRTSDEFQSNWITEKYLHVIIDALESVLDHKINVTLTHKMPEPVQTMLPSIRPEERMAPNALVRSALFGVIRRGRRKAVEDKLIESWREWSILYTGHELDQGDMDVWLQCLRLMHKHELGTMVHFSARGFLKELGRRTGKSDYKWLDRSLKRLKANALEVRQNNFAYVGSLVNEYYKDEDTGRFVLLLNPKLIGLFGLGLTRVQWTERLSLTRQVSKYLHFYIHSHRATPEHPHRIGIERLRALCGSETKRVRKFREQISESMSELETLGVIISWRITEGDALEFVRPYPIKTIQK